jgi:hypothetical protein
MKEYQVYSIDQNGVIIGNRVIEAENDDDAVISVRSMHRPHNTEVWCRDRRVGRIPGYAG